MRNVALYGRTSRDDGDVARRVVMDDGGMFRVQQPTAPIDPKKGVRKVPGRVQLGLTTKEISSLQERVTDLLARVDRGDVRVQ